MLFLDVTDLNEDEVKVLEYLADRLRKGSKAYGPLNLKENPRDWKKERAEELGDLLIYTAFEALKGEA